jgi:Peptidase_C39 like family
MTNRKNNKLADAILMILLSPITLAVGSKATLALLKFKLVAILVIILMIGAGVTIYSYSVNQTKEVEITENKQAVVSGKLKETDISGVKSKVLEVPYINQFLEPNGQYFPVKPTTGDWMCGAASSVMITAFFGKLPYNKDDEHDLKRYVYSDQGQNLPDYCGNGTGGAFGVTSKGANCSYSTVNGMTEYLRKYGLGFRQIVGFEAVKKAIDSGRPMYFSTIKPYNHLAVIKGYTEDGRLVMNDPFTDAFKSGNYSYAGKNALYSLNHPALQLNYIAEVYPL